MNQSAKPIILIIIDSVRHYKTNSDDRDRLSMMDNLSDEMTEFTNAYCTAPSSIMSGSSIFTGYNSQYLSLNYNDWKFDKDEEILSIQKILIDNGYKIYSIDNSKEGREMMADLTLPLKKKYFPKNISHANFWTNKEMNKILENIFNKFKVNKKSFFMMWFDCRGDKNTSQHIVNLLTYLRKIIFMRIVF